MEDIFLRYKVKTIHPRRPTPKKPFYDEANLIIKNAFLLEGPPGEGEINIEKAYDRSTRLLGRYVTLDWNHIQGDRCKRVSFRRFFC